MFNKILAILFILVLFNYAEEIQIIADRDNTIMSENGSNSNAIGDLFVGRSNSGGKIRRALVHFDVSASVPSGATIESVTLSLTVNKTKAATETISIHSLSANWGEGSSNGEGNGGPASANDATWTHAFFDSLMWSSAGADYNSTADGRTSVSGIGTYIWESSNEMVSTAQNWLDNPDGNFGWILIGNETSNTTTKKFDSRERTSKPTLTITYSTATSIEVRNGNRADQFILSKNYPNPFNPSTKIDITVPSTNNQNFTLQVFNITGQLVETIHAGLLPSGNYTFEWDGKNIKDHHAASGVYFYKLAGQNFEIMKKMILLR